MTIQNEKIIRVDTAGFIGVQYPVACVLASTGMHTKRVSAVADSYSKIKAPVPPREYPVVSVPRPTGIDEADFFISFSF